jgi:hypothetical protein
MDGERDGTCAIADFAGSKVAFHDATAVGGPDPE